MPNGQDKRSKTKQTIIWIIGGDRDPRSNSTDPDTWRAMAKGVIEGVGNSNNVLLRFIAKQKRQAPDHNGSK